ncbi:MAG: hypothetical protein ACE15D_00490 [Candidatus Eisenbacteria bacterium]|nr:hypothetical protein [Candidatus Eisenbacteria bacterium]
MLRRYARWGGVLGGLAVLALAGCSQGPKPCMIIPAQIELARDVRDDAQAKLTEKQKDADRWKITIEQSRARIARLTEERDQLKQEVGGSGSGASGASGSGGAK